MATNPTLLTMPLAQNGQKNAIPATQATAGDGLFSQSTGFPAETSLPLGAGGVAPSREDFNGMANLLGGVAFYAQKGWQFQFDAGQDYFAGCVVRDTTDGALYECINDVSAGGSVPSADSVNWQPFGSGGGGAFNTREEITTSDTWTAPATGVYRVTCIGGGGAGGNGGKSGTGGVAGTQGGTTSFGVYVSAAGGHSGGAGGASSAAGGGAAGNVVTDYVSLTENDSISVTIGAGGVAPSSGYSSGSTGENGSGGAIGGASSCGGAGGSSIYGSGGNGCCYTLGSSSVYGAPSGGGFGGSNGTPYGGGGGGGCSGYNSYSKVPGAPGGGNGQAAVDFASGIYPKGGDGGNGAVIIEYYKKEE